MWIWSNSSKTWRAKKLLCKLSRSGQYLLVLVGSGFQNINCPYKFDYIQYNQMPWRDQITCVAINPDLDHPCTIIKSRCLVPDLPWGLALVTSRRGFSTLLNIHFSTSLRESFLPETSSSWEWQKITMLIKRVYRRVNSDFIPCTDLKCQMFFFIILNISRDICMVTL